MPGGSQRDSNWRHGMMVWEIIGASRWVEDKIIGANNNWVYL